MDTTRVEELHIVRKVRDTVRRWWGIELAFTDASGAVVDHGKGIIIPPSNRICSACLGDKEGLRRCNDSVRRGVVALGVGRGSGNGSGNGNGSGHGHGDAEPVAKLVGPCHMGLDVIAAPIQFGGRARGTLFACGFLVDDHAGGARPTAQATLAELGLPVGNPDNAFAGIARIDRRDVGRLSDLMATTVGEIADYEDALTSRDASIRELRNELSGRFRFADIIGKSAPMQRLFGLLDKVVDSDITVLVTGENGTGKEMVARAVHFNGPRKDKPFVAQNCSALNDNLLESELFGHVKGSFTGAARDKVGLFKVADGGTFFLDEVADCSPSMQVKLLRVLQEGTFIPVGATRPEQVDVRIVAATNKDLRKMVDAGQFREDLFYRLHVLNVEVPSLRQRIDDLPLLTDHFLARLAKRTGRPAKRLSPELLARLYEWRWPGNVRELENEIERLWVLSGDAEVIPAELRDTANGHARPAAAARELQALVQKGLTTDMASAVGELERELIRAGLEQTRGNKTRLAGMLGVSRTTLIKKIKEHGIHDAEG